MSTAGQLYVPLPIAIIEVHVLAFHLLAFPANETHIAAHEPHKLMQPTCRNRGRYPGLSY